jgi:hypothetical protein
MASLSRLAILLSATKQVQQLYHIMPTVTGMKLRLPPLIDARL